MFDRFFGIRGSDQETVLWNLKANIADGTLFALGMSFVSIQTILPVFVQSMGGSNVAVGLVPVIWVFGFNVPQIFVVQKVQRLPWKKPLFMKTSLIQRIPWLLLALVCFFILEHSGTITRLVIFFSFFLLAAVGGSLNLPVWFDLIAKLTPVKMRGRMFAARSILGAVLGIGGGAGAVVILGWVPFPENYGVLFLVAFVFMMVSYLFLTRLKEESESPAPSSAINPMKAAAAILMGQKNFRNFLISDAMLISSSMANAFFAVYALKKFSLPDAYAGLFTVVMMGSMIVASFVIGFLADHYGHKVNLMIHAVAMLGGSVAAVFAPTLELFLAVFACSAVTISVSMISRLPMVAELCSEEERPSYIAVTNMITSPFVLLGIAAGWMADEIGYELVFLFSSAFALAALYWLAFRVQEPRRAVIPAVEHQ